MLETLAHWVPAFDPDTGAVAVPVWAIGATTAALVGVIVLICLFAFACAGRKAPISVLARLVLMGLVAAATWVVHDYYGADISADRRALDARIAELAARALTPGSALACLDATAGETVEAACEKTVFATPEATAAAASYVSAQLSLLADASEYSRRSGSDLAALTNLRHALELDRFGIAARVLTVRDGCTPKQCPALAVLHNPARVKANLSAGTFDLYVLRHVASWPAAPGSPNTAGTTAASAAPANPEDPVARTVPEQPVRASAPGSSGRYPLAKLFFPSSDSIPAINIMSAEPNAAANSNATDQSAKTPSPSPPRKPAAGPAAAAAPPMPPARRPPADPNASARSVSAPQSLAPTLAAPQ